MRTPTGRSRIWRTRLSAALFRGCSCGSRMPGASHGGSRRPEDAPELLRPPPPPISATHGAERWFSPRTPRGILPPRATAGRDRRLCIDASVSADGPRSVRLHERRRLALSNPVRDRAAEGLRGGAPNEHETSTRDRRRSDEQDCLLPGWPAKSPGGHPHGVICRSDDPGSRLLHDRRWETFPGAVRQAIRRALARAVITARSLLARSAR